MQLTSPLFRNIPVLAEKVCRLQEAYLANSSHFNEHTCQFFVVSLN